MNFNIFDGMDGLVLRERENSLQNQPRSFDRHETNNANSSRFPQDTPLAMAYVPFQQWGKVYSEDEAFDRGTLFPELDFPFEIGGASK